MRALGHRGATLIESLVAAVIVAGVGATLASIFAGQMRALKNVGNYDARTLIDLQLANTISERISMQNTAADLSNAGSDFGVCIGGGGTCHSMDSAGVLIVNNNLNLYNSTGAKGVRVAGAGVRYNPSAEICAPTDPVSGCPYTVTAAYSVDCNGIQNCPQARRLRVSFKIHHDDPTAARPDLLSQSDAGGEAEIDIPFTTATGATPDYVPLGVSYSALSASAIHQPPALDEIQIGMGTVADAANLDVFGNTTVGGTLYSNAKAQVAGSIEVTKSLFNFSGDMSTANDIRAGAFFIGYPSFYPTANGHIEVGGTYWAYGPVISHDAVFANQMVYTSDRILKTKIGPINDVIGRVDKLIGRSFVWRKNQLRDIGFIAQNVESAFPELVGVDSDGYKTVRYGNLIAVILEAYRLNRSEVLHQLAAQDARISELERQMAELEMRTTIDTQTGKNHE